MSLRKFWNVAIAVAVICGLSLYLVSRTVAASDEPASGERVYASAPRDDAAAAAAFESMVAVLHHPRCMSCHSQGDFPREGDDQHPHTMDVRRGGDGDGVTALKCGSCHQSHNLEGEHMPPGAPGWHLPPSGMPMIWEGLTGRQLCDLFKDPAQNGGRGVDEIVEHMNTPLVQWGWNPGEGRTPIPMPRAEFLAKVKEWASKGAACPSDSAGSAPAHELSGSRAKH